jgi:hypothetical protein
MPEILSTSELLEKTAKEHPRDTISLGEIKSALHERGFGILFIVFSLPLLIPLPVPTGLGTALSVPIFFFAYQLTINVDSPWLPSWVLKKELSTDFFRKIVAKSGGVLRFIEKFSKERVFSVSDSRRYEIFIGVFILLLTIPICLPFPLSNTLPAASIIIIAFGMIEKDGVMIILGQIVGLISWLVCIAIGFAIYYGANEVMKFVPENLRDDVKELKEKYVPHLEHYQYPDVLDNDAAYENILDHSTNKEIEK